MRSQQQIDAVQAAAVNLEETAPGGPLRDTASYAAGVSDVLAWLKGDVSPRVFRGFSEAAGLLTAAAEGTTQPTTAQVVDEATWLPIENVPGDFYELWFVVNLDTRVNGPLILTEADVQHLAQLAGYAWAAEVRGESFYEPVVIRYGSAITGFTVAADSTKSRRDDIGIAVERFLDRFHAVIGHGTPVRRTDRSGPGTKGTRLVEPFRAPVQITVLAR